jgi:hypothetical protein
MILFSLVIIVFIAFPFLCVAIALKSKLLLIFGLSVGLCYLVFFLFSAFSDFLNDLRAVSLETSMDGRLHALWSASGPERTQVRFWIYSSSEAQFKVWINGSRLEVFFSQGLLNLATDAGLKAAFKSMSELDFSDVKLQNKRQALTLRFSRLKGPQEDFRYWFLSFWLYPLERSLKIAKL